MNLFPKYKPLQAPDEAAKVSRVNLVTASRLDTKEVLTWVAGNDGGLTQQEAERRITQYGRNELVQERPPSWYAIFLKNFLHPFVIVLFVLGAISFATGDQRAVIVMLIMVAVSVLLNFFQEFRSSRAAEKLKEMVHTTSSILRQYQEERDDGTIDLASRWSETHIHDLVPGDIIRLSAGDMVPADIRVLSSKDLYISQSALTGESMPVEKDNVVTAKINGKAKSHSENHLELRNLCFLGTNVISGSAQAVVITTGSNTFFGALSQGLAGKRPENSFEKGVKKVSWVLIQFMITMVPIVFLVNGFTKGDWHNAFLFAIAIAVGLTPEMLPVIVTANLAKGAVAMSKEKVIVKKVNAIQNLGAMDILCTDKTGTLTQDKIVLLEYVNIHGHKSPSVLEYAYMNSYFQTGLRSLLDRAVLDFPELQEKLNISNLQKIDEIPFDFTRRRMSVVVENKGEHLLVCKGATEEILKICTHADDNGKIVSLSDSTRAEAVSLKNKFNQEGLRVIAVAYKRFKTPQAAYHLEDESDLVLTGFIDFLDPPKETASVAIKALTNDGVTIKILTGDNDLVTRHICKHVGIACETIVLGSELQDLSEKELANLADKTTVFAKVNPEQKARIIRALKTKGHTVGFMGDGINDAPALREADVGISVDTAADIAKESSDIILLEKSLLVLQTGVIKGRQVYGNIMKYIKMTSSSNFGNVLSVLTASIFLPFLPMLPIHFLIQNLCYDFSQLSIPWDTMSKDFLEKPRKWDPSGIARFMLCIGSVSSLFDIATFFVLWYIFRANSVAFQGLFQSGWFIEGLLSQTLIIHMIRTPKLPFFQSNATPAVMFTTLVIMTIGILIPFSPLGKAVGMIPPPIAYFPWLIGILIAYSISTQIVKVLYIRKFKSWL